MSLIKTSLLNSIAVIVRMLTMLGLNKLFALYVGPAGYALVGQFQNFVQMVTTFASGAITTGVVKYTSEYNNDPELEKKLWSTSGKISLIGALVAGTLIILFRKPLSVWLLLDESFQDVFVWFALCLVLFVFNTLLLAVLNGKKDIRKYVLANISGSLLGLAIIGSLAALGGLRGALTALGIYQSVIFFATLWVCSRTSWFRFKDFFGAIDKDMAMKLGGFTLMALTAAICMPANQLFVRSYITVKMGPVYAGSWEAMSRLSGAYMMMVTSTLSVYYLPRIAEITSAQELKKEILGVYKVVLPFSILCSLGVYLFRDFVIHLLFSQEFHLMRGLFSWQLVGDIFKMGGWIAAYVYIGRAFFKLYILSEILFIAIYCPLSVLFIDTFGFQGAAMAYASSYLLYFVFVLGSLRYKKVI